MSLLVRARALLPLVPLVFLGAFVTTGAAQAQPTTPEKVPPSASTPTPTSGAGPGGTSGAPPLDTPSSAGKPPGEKVAAVESSGLTADLAAARAVKTSNYVAVDVAKLAVAAAQVDTAWDAYLPKLTLSARYTRLSPITPPSLGSGSSVVTTAPPGPITAATPLFAAPPFSFPVILNQYVAQASLLIPLSDYVFRIYHAHEGALAAQEAAKWQIKVTQNNTAADARVAFYNVLRARGSVLVAKAAVGQSEAHLKDLKNRLELKVVTIADVARVEAQLAAAELAVIKTENLVILTEANLRMLMHASQDEAFGLGEDLDAELPKQSTDLKALRAVAFEKRPELKAIDAQVKALEARTAIVAAGMYPRLDAIGNVIYANPNQRFFPQTEEFKATWDVSVQLSWSPNDVLIAGDQKKESSANLSVVKATREQLADALTLDVTSAYTRVKEAEASIVATLAETRAAEEAYRVRREQFTLGSTTSALLIDAEADLTRARLNALNARVDLRIAKVQLRKAIGDV